jgi:hypothetical protein
MPTDPIGWILALVVIIPVLAVATVYFRGSKDKGTIDTYDRNFKAQEAYIARLEADAARNKLDADRTGARLSLSERENTQLRAQRPSAEVIARLATDLDSLRVELHKHDLDIKRLLKKENHDAG